MTRANGFALVPNANELSGMCRDRCARFIFLSLRAWSCNFFFFFERAIVIYGSLKRAQSLRGDICVILCATLYFSSGHSVRDSVLAKLSCNQFVLTYILYRSGF